MKGLTVNTPFRTKRTRRRDFHNGCGETTPTPAEAAVPRVAKLMALAIRFDQLIQDGVVKDQAELAALGRVTRARLTQIMNLLCLAPDLQEAILLLPTSERGETPITERHLRHVSAIPSWDRQILKWQRVLRTVNM